MLLKFLGGIAFLAAVAAQTSDDMPYWRSKIYETGDDCVCANDNDCANYYYDSDGGKMDLYSCEENDAIKEARAAYQKLQDEAAQDDIGQLLLQLEAVLEARGRSTGAVPDSCEEDPHQPICGIRRFKNLKAMVMTMQPVNVTVFGRYCYYGCWCLPNGQHNLAAGFGQPVDPIDEVCKEFALCYKCLDLDFAGSCNPEKRSYRWGRLRDSNGVTYDLECRDDHTRGAAHRCKRYTCECDRVLAIGLGHTHWYWNESHHARWGGFDREASCETDCIGCIPQDDCCGAYGSASTATANPMTRRPYASTNPNSGCCQDVFYYNTVSQECCIDGSTVSVTDFSTCPGTAVGPDAIDDFDDSFPGYTRK